MRFGDFWAIRNINLEVEEGEYLTILGPSGCGKTTLIKLISGIWTPTEGKVFVDGKDVTRIPMEDRDTGYVFQNIALFPNMTISENVGYSPRVKDRPEDEIEGTSRRFLELVRMFDRAGMIPDELSGGEQQKVAIARALASGSKMLMLDEPLSALDARVRVELRYEIRRLVKELGITVLHVTHDQEEAMSVSDRIILMKVGGIQEIGTPLEMYRNPKSIFAANFIGETNLMECTVNGKDKNGRTVLRLRGGEEISTLNTEFPNGAPVVISVRPENVKKVKSGIKANVEGVTFMGTYWKVRALMKTNDYIEYYEYDVEGLPAIGDRIQVSMSSTYVNVFPRPERGLEEAVKLE